MEEDLKPEQLEGLTLHYVQTMDEVIALALDPEPIDTLAHSELEDREATFVP